MSNGGGVKLYKIRLIYGLFLAILFCITWISYGISEAAKYEKQANDKTSEYTGYTGEKVAQACIRISSVEKLECLNEAFEAKREYERNQTDLVAQRQSALWAYVMAAAAVIGMALSAVGVWLVKTTFDETRRANEIAVNAQRPWIQVECDIANVIFIPTGVNGTRNATVFGRILIKNVGDRPALRVWKLDAVFQQEDDNFIEAGESNTLFDQHIGLAENDSHGVNLLPNGSHYLSIGTPCEILGKLEQRGWIFKYVVSVIYRDQLTGILHQTGEVFILCKSGQQGFYESLYTDEIADTGATSRGYAGSPAEAVPIGFSRLS